MIDLDAYCRRIGYAGSRDPALSTLRAVIAHHTAAIPFESIDAFLGRPIRIDTGSLQAKLVLAGRGGYCFEHNALLLAALEAIGFSCMALLGRVVRGQPADVMTPRTHMMLAVRFPDCVWLADAGFGNLTPTAPVAFDADRQQPTNHEWYRLQRLGEEWLLQVKLNDVWEPLYRVPLQPVAPVDLEVANWFTSTKPGGPFTSNLVVARPATSERRTLFNTRLAKRAVSGTVCHRRIQDAADLRRALSEQFGLVIPERDVAALMSTLARQTGQSPADRFFT